MALMESSVCDFGWSAKDFNLLGTNEKKYTLSNSKGPNGILIMFLCNHCPYVQAIKERLVEDVKTIQASGIGVIAIMPNAVEIVPEDSFENMREFSKKNGYTFPYVIDQSQDVARAYNAICTPDFFGFNSELKLQYRGRLDESGRNPTPVGSKRELVEAMLEIAQTGKGPPNQASSIGCSIKWR